ncbi:mushroom body large-type Kenyon cell-specific protein 1 isoform X1 [Cimex lectularius]|uniref:HTH psq-type domain-containing protein n=3 Tax=Cimex lectularius TaxID=79782 RepID=A0A8I6S6X3_CIMLE|nr:mushroom body large-type Kenyon cell-specific protein 1 isoform X1 [Cimex lectularius]
MSADDEAKKAAARRQLAKWAKIMLQIVGLERVAEELMGRRSWASYQDTMVGQECRTKEPLCAPSKTVGEPGERSGSDSPSPMDSSPKWYIKPPDSPECLDEPLDLSAKPAQPPPSIKIPSPNKHIFNIVFDDRAKPRLSAVTGRRTYTEEELQAALRDIQSGKLGTRRAAVIYGIPRSTLRNKVYKLSQERRDVGGIESAKDDDDDDDDDRDLSEEEREVVKVLRRPLLSMEDVLKLPADGRAWPYLQQLLGAPHGLPDLVDRLARSRPSCSTDKEEPGVILRVPSYRPKDGGSPMDPQLASRSESPPVKLHAVSLRDVITNTINNKLATPESSVTLTTPTPQPLDFRRDLNVMRNLNNNHLDEKKHSSGNKSVTNNSCGTGSTGSNSSGGKGTRPKRGKYRNYDRDSLVEAVRAVQRGEMSVHRAGSYYGVPHSTLEYKVKERHLMRPRKREPKPQPQILPDEGKRKDERPRTQRFTPPLATANGSIKVPGLFDTPALGFHSAPPFPFWPSAPPFSALPLDYGGRELFASQMMQRLHEDATQPLTKTTREIAESLYDGTGENGNFLDGIIRSSLETGLPGAGKEAGKVLLEQLCRGGALTEQNKALVSKESPITVKPETSPEPPTNVCDTAQC